MKLLKTIMMLSMFVATTALAGGKDKVVQFHVSYDVTFESDDPNMAQALPFLAGSVMEVMKNDKYNKTIFKTGTMSTATTTLDNKTKSGISVTEGMMGNFYTKVDGSEEDSDTKVEVEKTEETTKILGYTCTKYLITTPEGELELWTTTEIKGEYKSKWVPEDKSIEGFPLKMVVEAGETTITFMATNYKDAVPAYAAFDLKPPKGYEEKSIEDLKKMGM